MGQIARLLRTTTRIICSGERRFEALFYKTYNRFKFQTFGVTLGKDPNIAMKVYLYLAPTAHCIIQDGFKFSSGNGLNPLCRNIRGMISVKENASLIIGNNVGISSSCIWASKSISIGNNVKIGGDCIIMDSDIHSLDFLTRRNPYEDIKSGKSDSIVIGDDVFIGARSIILKGVHIGEKSIIAAGSIVTNDIPADCIAGGNPCRIIRHISN